MLLQPTIQTIKRTHKGKRCDVEQTNQREATGGPLNITLGEFHVRKVTVPRRQRQRVGTCQERWQEHR